jgi:hypothetical protein
MALADFLAQLTPPGVVIDVKSILDRTALEAAGVTVWRL